MSLAAVSNAEILISKMILFGGVFGKLLDNEYRSFLNYISDNTVKSNPPSEDMATKSMDLKAGLQESLNQNFGLELLCLQKCQNTFFVVQNLLVPGILL